MININELLENNPIWLVDIGASGGLDQRWENFTSALKTILFEPDPREYEILKSKGREDSIILNCALSDAMKEIEFYLCKQQQVSSLFLPNFDFLNKFPDAERFEVLKTIKIKTDTLDNQLNKNNIVEIDFIKIDTQGNEYSILNGSVNSLRNVVGLEVEVLFAPLYKGQPFFSDIDKYIRSNGFELFDIKRYYWRRIGEYNYSRQKGQLAFGDALYFKNPEQVVLIKDITKEKIIRSICIYMIYGYLELANILSNIATREGILTTEIHDVIGLIIAKFRTKNAILNFPVKWRIRNILQNMKNIFCNTCWYSGTDRYLGNP